MNKEKKYDELVNFIREYDLYCRNLDYKGDLSGRVSKGTSDAILGTILLKISNLEKNKS